MLVRNCVLAVRWIYEIIEVTIYHIHGDGQGNTGDTVITNSVLLVVVLVGKQKRDRSFQLDSFVFVSQSQSGVLT